jgi:hypothetical protein
VWQRWLFRGEEDFVAASGLTGMRPCEDVQLPKNSAV